MRGAALGITLLVTVLACGDGAAPGRAAVRITGPTRVQWQRQLLPDGGRRYQCYVDLVAEGAGGSDGPTLRWTGGTLQWFRLGGGAAIRTEALYASSAAAFWGGDALPPGGRLTTRQQFIANEPFRVVLRFTVQGGTPEAPSGAVGTVEHAFACDLVYPPVEGRYALQTIGGRPLSAVVAAGGRLYADTLTFSPDVTYGISVVYDDGRGAGPVRTSSSGQQYGLPSASAIDIEVYPWGASGRAERDGTALRFRGCPECEEWYFERVP